MSSLTRRLRSITTCHPRAIDICCWLAVAFVVLGSPRPADAKPQLLSDCTSPFNTTSGSLNFFLWYNVPNSNEGSWDNTVSVDEYNGDNLINSYEDSITNDYVTTYLADTNPNTPIGSESFSGGPTTVVFSISGNWNGTSCSAVYSAGVGTAGDKTKRSAAKGRKPKTWSGSVVGKLTPTAPNTAQLEIDVCNTAAKDAHIYVSYSVITKTSLDSDAFTTVIDSTTQRRLRKLKPSGGAAFYTVKAPAQGTPSTTLSIADLTVPIPQAQYVFLDVFLVNSVEGNCWSLPRVQLYP
jgi:hypothetical protein